MHPRIRWRNNAHGVVLYKTDRPVFYNILLLEIMKKTFGNPIDFSKVDTLVYHLPDGPALSVEMDGLVDILDIDLEMGHVCDTSDIDGVVHFFPKGNA